MNTFVRKKKKFMTYVDVFNKSCIAIIPVQMWNAKCNILGKSACFKQQPSDRNEKKSNQFKCLLAFLSRSQIVRFCFLFFAPISMKFSVCIYHEKTKFFFFFLSQTEHLDIDLHKIKQDVLFCVCVCVFNGMAESSWDHK